LAQKVVSERFFLKYSILKDASFAKNIFSESFLSERLFLKYSILKDSGFVKTKWPGDKVTRDKVTEGTK
jgi:hypothetical protein